MPRDIRLFVQAPAKERILLIRAACIVIVARLALSLLAFAGVQRFTSSRQPLSPWLAAIPVRRLAWAVRATARRIPRATCLTQALALQHMLARAGHEAEIRIGVAKDDARGLESHAWVQCAGEIVLGDDCDLDRYLPILTLRAGEI